MDTQTAINDTKVNLTALKAALKDGPLNVRQLADKMGRSSPWDLEEGLRKLATTQEMVASLGVSVDFEITMFPARERARYHFPNIVPEVQGENPKRKRRKFKTVTGPDGKPVKVKRDSAAPIQKQYWPIVAWGTIEPDPVGTAEVAYDGRHDDDVKWLRELLTAKGFDFLDIKGRMVRGGSGIYISLVKDNPNATATVDAAIATVDDDDIVVEPSDDSADNDATVTA